MREIAPTLIKVGAAFAFVVVVMSFGRYDFWRLLPFFVFPAAFAAMSGLTIRRILKRSLIALPFVFFAALAGLFFEPDLPQKILSFASVMGKAVLCVAAALALSASTSITDMASALRAVKVPCTVVLQLLLTWRYLFYFADSAANAARSYKLRAPKRRGLPLDDWGKIVGSLFLRAVDKSENVYFAMVCRGFSAKTPAPSGRKISRGQLAGLTAFTALLLLLRALDFQSLKISL